MPRFSSEAGPGEKAQGFHRSSNQRYQSHFVPPVGPNESRHANTGVRIDTELIDTERYEYKE